MATKARKLPSGNYRSQVSFTGKDGKREYKSFTASTKKEAELLAAAFEMEKERLAKIPNWTLGEAIDQYIEMKRPTASPTTITGYEKIRNHSFDSIMNIPIGKLTEDMLQVAVHEEMNRPSRRGGVQSAKSVKNAYGLVSSVLNQYLPGSIFRVNLPKTARQIRSLPSPSDIFQAVKGSKIELACLLAMWLSLSESEIRGLTKSKSIDVEKDGTFYLTIREVVVWADGHYQRKALAKTDKRIRRHKVPPYIKDLIDQVEDDIIVPYIPSVLLRNLQRLLRENGLPEITFHDLRHVNASVMAMLHIPDVYAQERGGWASDHIMKSVYMETFSKERQAVDATIDHYFEAFIK